MISLIKADGQSEDNLCYYFAKSTDDKDVLISPTLPNGSIIYEIDTKDVYVYDKEEQAWLKQ